MLDVSVTLSELTFKPESDSRSSQLYEAAFIFITRSLMNNHNHSYSYSGGTGGTKSGCHFLLKALQIIKFPAIKPFRMQPHAKIRQPGILKVSPWQLCFETGAWHGAAAERVVFLRSSMITAHRYHHQAGWLRDALHSLVLVRATWKSCFYDHFQGESRKMPPHLNIFGEGEFDVVVRLEIKMNRLSPNAFFSCGWFVFQTGKALFRASLHAVVLMTILSHSSMDIHQTLGDRLW